MIRVRRALLSVHDKRGLVELARGLASAGVEIVSSGGTARALKEAGLAPVLEVSDVTGFPEMMDGRVKTLHPLVHGAILFRRDVAEHVRQARDAGIVPIDLVVVNLYPFERTAAKADATRDEIIEEIDIGGPALIRAAAKNHAHVAVVVDPEDYASILSELSAEGGISPATSARLATRAFARTGAYDQAIARMLAGDAAAPPSLTGQRSFGLRYGENPHQAAEAFTVLGESGGVLQAALLQGKELSYNNIVDLDAAWVLARDLAAPGAAIIKHANPCGAAEGGSPKEAVEAARACDPVSAFGGIFALNAAVDGEVARSILDGFVECVIAPSFTDEALEALAVKKSVRVLRGELPSRPRGGREWKRVTGGFLVQDWDDSPDDAELRVVTSRHPTAAEVRALHFAWRVVRHVKSNAILFAAEQRTLGVGAGQMSRVDAVDIAVAKARKNGLDLRGSVVASDAFFPFRDGLDAVAAAGATAVIQPGGSKRDDEVIAAAEASGLAMVFTGVRHFKH